MTIKTIKEIIPEKEVVKNVYVAFDGEEFSTEEDCLLYERNVKILNMFKVIKQNAILKFYDANFCSTFYVYDIANKKDFKNIMSAISCNFSLDEYNKNGCKFFHGEFVGEQKYVITVDNSWCVTARSFQETIDDYNDLFKNIGYKLVRIED